MLLYLAVVNLYIRVRTERYPEFPPSSLVCSLITAERGVKERAAKNQ